MRRCLPSVVLGLVASVAFGGTVAAQGLALFISPCGEPFRAPVGEPYPGAAWFAKVDNNKDGAIDRAELRAEATDFFKVLDQDHNGVISGIEVSYYERAIVPEILMGAQFGRLDGEAELILAQDSVSHGGGIPEPRRRQTAGGSMEGAGPYNLLGEAEPIMGSDANLDGRISLDEFLAAVDRKFTRLDPEGAGKLTLASVPRTVQQARLEDHGGGKRKGRGS